jgi:hypothetical protein
MKGGRCSQYSKSLLGLPGIILLCKESSRALPDECHTSVVVWIVTNGLEKLENFPLHKLGTRGNELTSPLVASKEPSSQLVRDVQMSPLDWQYMSSTQSHCLVARQQQALL